MAAVLQFRSDVSRKRRQTGTGQSTCEREEMGQIIIFPGVRRDSSDLDLSHRLLRYASEGGPACPADS